MQYSKIIIFLFIIIYISSCISQNDFSKNSLSKKQYQMQLDSINNFLQEGDIIFRGGTDIESAIIRDFSYNDKLFSHCGIVLEKENKLVVTHILGGTTNPNGSVLDQTIEDFFIYPDNESAGIYHIDLDTNEIERIYFYIDSVKKQSITFDLRFNLLDKSKLYCNEFIIEAIKYAKNKNEIFPCTVFNLKNTKYFSVVNKGDSFLFYPIDIFQHNKLLKEKAIFYFPNYRK